MQKSKNKGQTKQINVLSGVIFQAGETEKTLNNNFKNRNKAASGGANSIEMPRIKAQD